MKSARMAQTKFADMQGPIIPKVPFQACPIRASLGIFGKKWTLLILRDMTFLKFMRFSQILKNNSGLTPRALSLRLRDLQRAGLIERVVNSERKNDVKYRLTRKGSDTAPILTAFIQYGIRHYSETVFEDGRPRKLNEVFPEKQPVMLGKFLIAYAEETKSQPSPR